jgi:hypothetical protein
MTCTDRARPADRDAHFEAPGAPPPASVPHRDDAGGPGDDGEVPMTGQAATIQATPDATSYLEEELEPMPRQVRPGGYQVLERTLHVPAGLTKAHLRQLAGLLERRSLQEAPWRDGLRTELTGCDGDESALAYLREQGLPHTVTDRLTWGLDHARRGQRRPGG